MSKYLNIIKEALDNLGSQYSKNEIAFLVQATKCEISFRDHISFLLQLRSTVPTLC